MKVKALLIALLLGATALVAPAQANSPKTLVIIDTAINTQLDWVKNALIDEACFIEYGKCPNGQASMTGPGAAHINPTLVKHKALSHGTQMASVAVATNPNVKFAFVRIAGMSDKGFTNTYTTKAVAQALTWVRDNATRLNVGAVSISVGRTYSEASCPVAAEPQLQSLIDGLAASNIPTVIAAGNNSNPSKVNYPACIPSAIAVGATDTPYTVSNVKGLVYPIMRISNGGSDLDLYAKGRHTVTDINGVKAPSLGTSGATVFTATRLASSLSDGSTLAVAMGKVAASLQNAYFTATNFVKKQW